MLNSYPVGFDPGNSETSLVVFLPNGEQRTLTIPSYAGRGSFSTLKRFRQMHSAQADVLQSGEYILRCPAIDASEYFVGTLALSQSQHATSARGDINRYWSTLMLFLLLTVMGALIPDAAFEVSLVMGIPIETYSDQNRLKVRKALEGDHHFTLNGRERRVTVQVAKVIMEGAGAMIAVGDERPIRQAVIDIGGRTTDLYTADGQKPVTPLCKGIDLGVELAGDLVRHMFEDHFGRTLTALETRSILRATVGSEHYPPIYAHGHEVSSIDIRHLANDALSSVGRDITTFVGQSWASGEHGDVATDLAKVLLVGGGAYAFSRDIARLLPQVVIPPQPEVANALGYAELARHVQAR